MKLGKLKRLLGLIAISSIACSAYAVRPGLYMGVQVGPGTNNASPVFAKTLSGTPPTTEVNPQSNQFGSHMYMGYKGSDYVAAEFGFTYFSTIAYDNKGVQTCASTNARVRDIDVMGRLSYPYNGFEPFVKAGAAVVFTMTSGGLNSGPDTCGRTQYTNNVKPTYAIGLGYDLSQNWVIDASANHLTVPGTISSMTYYALGISFHFVDKYCGQFLCDD